MSNIKLLTKESLRSPASHNMLFPRNCFATPIAIKFMFNAIFKNEFTF